MWTDGYCATNECGAWAGATPEAAWMAAPEHDAAFHDSLLATIFPGAIVAAGAFYRFDANMTADALTAAWRPFNDDVLAARGVRTSAATAPRTPSAPSPTSPPPVPTRRAAVFAASSPSRNARTRNATRSMTLLAVFR